MPTSTDPLEQLAIQDPSLAHAFNNTMLRIAALPVNTDLERVDEQLLAAGERALRVLHANGYNATQIKAWLLTADSAALAHVAAGNPPVTVRPQRRVNWGLVAGITVGVVVAGAGVYYMTRDVERDTD